MKLRKTMCATCPFREGSRYAELVPTLTASSLTETSRICHSTGSNAIHHRTGLKPALCRGARDVQLRVMCGLGVIAAPTDEAWNEQRVKIGMRPTIVKDPKKGKK